MCLLTEFVFRLSDLLLTSFQPTTWRIMTFTYIIIQEMTASAQGFDKTLSTDGCLYASHRAGHYLAISLLIHCSLQLFNLSRRELSHRGSKHVERPFLHLNPLQILHRTLIIFFPSPKTLGHVELEFSLIPHSWCEVTFECENGDVAQSVIHADILSETERLHR